MQAHPTRSTLLVSLLSATATLGFSACKPSASLTPAERVATAPLTWARLTHQTALVSAHRGQPELPGYAENALRSVERLLAEGTFVIEVDVAMSSDSVLLLFHDDELDGLTQHRGPLAAREWAELDTMRLWTREGLRTESTIPSLAEFLSIVRGRALLTLDRKAGVPYELIATAVSEAGVEASTALITYDEDDLAEWAALPDPGAVSFSADGAEALLAVGESAPDDAQLLLFAGVGRPTRESLRTADRHRLPVIVGTFGELDEAAELDDGATYRRLIASGVDILATNRPLAALAALATPEP